MFHNSLARPMNAYKFSSWNSINFMHYIMMHFCCRCSILSFWLLLSFSETSTPSITIAATAADLVIYFRVASIEMLRCSSAIFLQLHISNSGIFSRIRTAIEASVITNSSLKKFEFEFGLQTWTYQVLHVWFSNEASRMLHIPFLFKTWHVLIDRITWWPQLLYDDISPV